MNEMNLPQAIIVTAEVTGFDISEAAAEAIAMDLQRYERVAVMKALSRCRRELKTRLSLAAIIERIDDGRPGPEEAWAMLPKDERGSVVWTEEMAQAYGVCFRMIESGDAISARMAFKETYARLVSKARDECAKVLWTPSLGHDESSRQAALSDAVAKGRLSYAHAQDLCPMLPPPSTKILETIANATKALQ